jgi:hypothetical protein
MWDSLPREVSVGESKLKVPKRFDGADSTADLFKVRFKEWKLGKNLERS